jgi:hypothetical protein
MKIDDSIFTEYMKDLYRIFIHLLALRYIPLCSVQLSSRNELRKAPDKPALVYMLILVSRCREDN